MIDANKLKGAIKSNGLTQAELANKIGIYEQTLPVIYNIRVLENCNLNV